MASASVATPFAPFAYSYAGERSLEFHIVGGEAQVLQVLLPPNAKIQAEPGALFYMSSKVACDTGGSGLGNLLGSLARIFSGESYFVNTYTNKGAAPEYVAFATPSMARILPLDLNVLGGEMFAQSNSYFCSIGDVRVSSKMVGSLSTGIFGGEGMVLQRLSGSGLCFITAGGTPVQKELREGETVYVDAGCLVAFSSSIKYDLKYSGSIKSALFGGEGIFLQKLVGPGLVILESLPRERLVQSLNPQARVKRNRQNNIPGLIGMLVFLLMVIVFLSALLPANSHFHQEFTRHFEL